MLFDTPTHTILISSLSKAVSAGLRVGFVAAPRMLVGRIASAVRTSCWMATPLASEIGACWILDGTAATLRELQRREIRRRKALVAQALEGLDVWTNTDSYHYWIALPDPWRASELVSQLKKRNILVKAAEAFAVGHLGVPQCIRASLSGVDDDELIQGFQQLAETIREGPYRSLDA